MKIEIAQIRTPVGAAHLAVVEGALCALTLDAGWDTARRRLDARFDAAEEHVTRDPAGVATALGAYFDGDLGALDGLDVAPSGTPFQLRVWRALRGVQAGTTVSYAALAAAAGAPAAVRAVGTAMGANPIWIVQPCHRVVRADGSLGGYAGGLEVKEWLLAHEGARPDAR